MHVFRNTGMDPFQGTLHYCHLGDKSSSNVKERDVTRAGMN